MHYIIIPTYQERENIARTVHAVLALRPDVRVIVVDDHSTDGTGDELKKLLAEASGRLEVVFREPPRSFAGSYIRGFSTALAHADCESVIECDADGSHPVDRIPLLIEKLREVDVAIGSRYVSGGDIAGFSRDRRLLSSAANVYLRFCTCLPVVDITAGFVAYRADFLTRLPYEQILSNGYAFQIEMKWLAARAGARFCEIPITFIDRSHGHSKMSFQTMIEAFMIGLRYLFQR